MPSKTPRDFACLAAPVSARATLSYSTSVGGRPVRSPIPPYVTPDSANAPISAVLSMATLRYSIASSGCLEAQTGSGRPREQTAFRSFISSSARECAVSTAAALSKAISMKSIVYLAAAATAFSAPARSQFIVHMLVCTPKPCMVSYPPSIRRQPAQDHHGDQEQAPHHR